MRKTKSELEEENEALRAKVAEQEKVIESAAKTIEVRDAAIEQLKRQRDVMAMPDPPRSSLFIKVRCWDPESRSHRQSAAIRVDGHTFRIVHQDEPVSFEIAVDPIGSAEVLDAAEALRVAGLDHRPL